MARMVARIGVGLIILGVFVFGVFPTDRFIDQREQLDKSQQELDELLTENADLQARVDRLESDEEIERVARDEYDLVYPNEEVYAVLPPAGG
jgi:cell division protein FtsL